MYHKPAASRKPKPKFLIIAEGEREDLYFGYFEKQSGDYDVNVEIVPREDGKSAPKHIDDRLEKYKDSEKWLPSYGDQLWFIFDVDKWGEQLHELVKECEHDSRWHIAISNPCFEVWLHYHNNASISGMTTCDDLKRELQRQKLGHFDTKIYAPQIEAAIINSKATDTHPGQLFPAELQTKVYKLAEQLLDLMKTKV